MPNPYTPKEAGKGPPVEMSAFNALEGGIGTNGDPLLPIQAYQSGRGWTPGTVAVGSPEGEAGWYFAAYPVDNFRILVWADDREHADLSNTTPRR